MRRTFLLCLASAATFAAAPRPVPPVGIAIPDADRSELQASLSRLTISLEKLKGNPLVADVRVFTEAVRFALDDDGFYKPEEVGKARELLRQASLRAESLAEGKAPWLSATGLVVRGYVSKIDGSVQPYGLVIPAAYTPAIRWRLDTWFHGRGETLTQVNFLWDRMRNPGEFAPPRAIVLHLYGRYCNANKFAGEVDLFEALDHVGRAYPIDENRVVVRGFSMGGAATWHIAAHHAGRWAAAAPGAGFAETAEYTGIDRNPARQPEWWVRKLFHLYDATDYALNLSNTAVVAYSGEIDKQKQAADIMARSLEAEGMRMTHVIGPNTAHKYHPESKAILGRIIDSIAERGRDPYPREVRFTTWTLRYNRMKWVAVDGMEKHWERARVDAGIEGNTVNVKTANVTAFSIAMGPGGCPLDPLAKARIVIDGAAVPVPGPMTDRSWTVHLAREAGRWTAVDGAGLQGLAKRHGLQGPIDDAFMDSFIMVKPTGTAMSPAVSRWAAAEQDRAIREWRRQFRGDARVRTDAELTDEDIAGSNLVLWGDPGSNRVLGRILDRLPVEWTAKEIAIAGKRFDAASHAPILIYPNPLNPSKYVVVNSGFTFREGDYLTNANQVPRLPDYAVVDLSTPPDARWPGKIALAGFFDERWRAQP